MSHYHNPFASKSSDLNRFAPGGEADFALNLEYLEIMLAEMIDDYQKVDLEGFNAVYEGSLEDQRLMYDRMVNSMQAIASILAAFRIG